MNVSNLSGNFIIDMDEVLVNISPGQYRAIRENWLRYNRFFNDLGPLKDKDVLNRPTFKLTDWLLKDEYKNLENLLSIKEFIHQMIRKDYFSTDLYANMEPTDFAKKTLMNKAFMEHIRVKKVYILTRYVDEEMLKSKKKFIKKYFNHSKIELIAVPLHEKKSDYIKKLNIDWNIFVDDEIKNIADFAENLDIEGKEFLIPKFGYNEMPDILDVLIKGKGAVYNYYEQ
jgi:hypothetical protein